MENALTLKNVNVWVSPKFSLKNISFDIPKGSICGLVGKNSAGKTTLIHTIMNLRERTQGTVLYHGMLLWEHELEIKKMLNCVFDDFLINKDFKIKKYAEMLSIIYENFDYEFYEKYMERFGLDENERIKNCSMGTQKKWNIILTMACRPKILILDEPTSGLDPASRADVLDMLMDFMQDEEHTILFSTHITGDLDKIADYIMMIDEGRIVFFKEKNELIQEYSKIMGGLPTVEDIMVYLGKEWEHE